MSALTKFLDKRSLEAGKKPDQADRRVATVAIRHGEHLLMGKRRDNGKWTTPGGHAEGKEDLHDAALREVEEESGIKLERHQVVPIGEPKTVTDDKGKKLQVQGFEARLDERPSTSMKQDPDAEVHKWQWVDCSKGLPDHIEKALHVPMERNVLLPHVLGDSQGEEKTMNKGSALHKWAKKNGKFEDLGSPVPAGGKAASFDEEADPDMDDDDIQLGHDQPKLGKGHGTYKAPKGSMKGYC